MAAVVLVRNLGVRFRGGLWQPPVQALQQVDLQVAAGEIVGILGANGSGKTTLLKVLAGVQQWQEGQVQVLGESPSHPQSAKLVGFKAEAPLPFQNLSAPEFLRYLGSMQRLPKAELRSRAETLLQRLQLSDLGKRRIKTFSTGMQQRLSLAAALLSQPKVLLLDEPTSGLDPMGSQLVIALLQEEAERGTAICMASHHLQEVEECCHRICILQHGKVVAQGSLDELLGTGAEALLIQGLDSQGLAAVQQTVQQCVQEAGGEVVQQGQRRQHLFALLRKLQASRSKA